MSLEVISVIDIDPSQPYISVVHCKQYDTVRVVEAHLYTDGVKWYVPSNNIYAMVQYRKSDHIGGFYDIVDDPSEPGGKRTAVSINSGDRSIIYISIAQEVLTTATPLDSEGTTVEVVFYDTISNARLGLFYFHLKVEEASIREVDLANNPYFNILAEQIKAVLEAETKLTGLTAEAETLAPDDDATVTVTGGSGSDDPYHFVLGIPSMPGMTATASSLPTTSDPTAVITGGTLPGEDFNIAFGIPKGVDIVSMTAKYGYSMSEYVLPASDNWVDHLEDLHVPNEGIQWTKVVTHCSDGNDYIQYAKCAQGYPGPPGVAVQTTQPNNNTLVWINPDEDEQIVIPQYTSAEDATIHSFGGTLMTTVKTIVINE